MTLNPQNPFEDFDETPSDGELKSVSETAQQMVELEQECLAMEEQLNERKKALWRLQNDTLPSAMAAVGLSEFTLKTGQKIVVKEKFQCTLPKDESVREQAFEYLRTNNAGELIKRNVSLQFGKGEDQVADALIHYLSVEKGLKPMDKAEVHWRTLTSWAKEQHERGVSLPADLLGLYIGMEAKVKR